jgi:nanoRNase/pAp phosphatase (c-di-AMP/oligoRNAs hydrolase)
LEKNKKGIIKIGTALAKQIDKVVERHIEKAKLITFEGYEVYACNAPTIILDKLGEKLNEKKGPFTILYRFERDNLRVLFRGNGTIDVSEIAKKYGGGGHKDAAGIRFKNRFPLSFLIGEDE